MAYTYDDFVTAANGAGVMNMFSQDDLGLVQKNPEFGLSMVKLQQDINSATTTEQKLLAQEAQNQLRKVYGGLTTGAAASSTDAAGSTGSFTYGKQDQLDDLTQKVVNGGSFTYDPNNTSAAAVRKRYLREAERAREDTMAKAAAGSGGVPSSYAVTAAQQAGDYHVAQLADREAELEQTAYQRYLQEFQKNISQLGALTDERDFDYTAYLNQIQKDREDMQSAINLYNTYAGSMSIAAMREMFKGLGYTAPGITTFLDNMEALQAAQAAAAASYDGGIISAGRKPETGSTLPNVEFKGQETMSYKDMLAASANFKNVAQANGYDKQTANTLANVAVGNWYQAHGKYA